jgi:2-succinyl-5-enolpyruvyl-6-hydroxy-3-cyclohexene-1-carboxylate synthase
LRSVERGLLVCGPQDDAVLAPALADLSAALGWPLLADPISQLRCGPHHHALIIDSYDAFLRDEAFVHANPPELIVRFGAMPTAKPFLQYVQRNPACRLLVVDGGAGWNEPTSQATDVIYADPVELCRALVAELLGALERGSGGAGRQIENSASSAFSAVQTGESAWASVWMRAQQVTRATLAAALLASDEIFEGRVFAELGSLLPVGATLYVGNSMPIRDCDTFLAGGTKALRLLGNRGANGIDGVVSSALGAAAAGATPLTLVIGDLSLYHDSNGLLAAKQQGLNATIVLLNNEGGGIFSFLPQAAERDHFEVLFGTPSGLDFRHLAALYGAQYCQPQSWAAFRAALLTSWATPGLHLIELRTNREHNVAQHRTLWPLVSAALASL